jgi:hypothetical protein
MGSAASSACSMGCSPLATPPRRICNDRGPLALAGGFLSRDNKRAVEKPARLIAYIDNLP